MPKTFNRKVRKGWCEDRKETQHPLASFAP